MPRLRQDRKKRIARLVELLDAFEHFHVALAPGTPPLELEIKSLDCLMLRSTGESLRREVSTWGLRNAEFTDRVSVLYLAIDFWRHYYDIAPEYRDKDKVIALLTEYAQLPRAWHISRHPEKPELTTANPAV